MDVPPFHKYWGDMPPPVPQGSTPLGLLTYKTRSRYTYNVFGGTLLNSNSIQPNPCEKEESDIARILELASHVVRSCEKTAGVHVDAERRNSL